MDKDNKQVRQLLRLVDVYIITFPIVITIFFCYFAIRSGGLFTIDMTSIGEYELEEMLIIGWAVLSMTRGISVMNHLIGDIAALRI